MSYPVTLTYNSDTVTVIISDVTRNYGPGPTDPETGEPLLDEHGNPLPGDYLDTMIVCSLVHPGGNASGQHWCAVPENATDDDLARNVCAQYGITIV